VASTVMRRRWTRGLATALALGMLATACGGGGDDSGGGSSGSGDEGTPTPGGKIVYGLEAETADGWCLPEAQLAISGIMVARTIYDTLTRPDAEGKYQPWLAESVTPSADKKEWTIKLREGIKFHDGTPLTAEVVKNNLDAYRGAYPARKPLLFIFTFGNIASVDVVDPLTVSVKMKQPWAAFDAYLYGSGRVGMMAQSQLDDTKSCADKLVGTGPFKMKEWVPNQKFVADKNPDYWAKDAEGRQLPYLDEIEYRPIVEVDQRVNALESGDIQAMHTSDPATIADLRGTAESGDIDLTESTDFGEVSYVMMNSSKPPFDNVKARQALAYAFNFDDYNTVRGKGILTRASGPFAPGNVGNLDADQTGFPQYDLDKAKQLVQEYEDETGKPLKFSYSTVQAASTIADAQFLKDQAEKAGMQVDITTIDQSSLIDTAIEGGFQAVGWRNHPGGDPDEQYVWWESASPVNFGRIKDPEIDKLLNEGRTSTDQDARKTIYEDLNKRFGQEVYNLWNYYTPWSVATAKDVHGVLGEGPTSAKPFPGLAVGNPVMYMWVDQ
jgi:peptide/nickel transport system substrate-binding protein